MHFLNADSEEDFEMIRETNVPIMKKAVNVIYDLSEDTRIREMARIREKALHDEASALADAESKGRMKERNAMIEALQANGVSEELIQLTLENMK